MRSAIALPPVSTTMSDPIRRAERVRAAMPEGGLFAEKEWRVSPEPFVLSKAEVRQLAQLGRSSTASENLRSSLPAQPRRLAARLDREGSRPGKPEPLLSAGLASATLTETPRVIRPDLILTSNGFSATELDSVPGGIGLTAWLGETYAALDPAHEIVGGADGMFGGFASIFGRTGPISSSRGNRPAIAPRCNGSRTVSPRLARRRCRDLRGRGAGSVSFSSSSSTCRTSPPAGNSWPAAAAGRVKVTAPFKPWLEEKMWSALFWSHPLRDVWKRELRESNWNRLRSIFPQSWIVDPAEVPHHAVIPGLEIGSFAELKHFTRTERELVLKLSGFNEHAWGSRSVTVGQDASQSEWGEAVDEAIASYERAPYVLQRFHAGRLVTHPWWNPATGRIEMMEGRVRLCPYYFVSAKDESVALGGVLATICPSDKKILHGMRDAILVPCRVE